MKFIHLIFIGILSSLVFLCYNLLTSCQRNSLPYLLFISHYFEQHLDQFLYYALTPDSFDPLTDVQKDQRFHMLQVLCQKQSQLYANNDENQPNHSSEYYMHRILDTLIFNNKWSSHYLRNKCRACFINHWTNIDSKLSLMENIHPIESNFNFNQFITDLESLSFYIRQNCRKYYKLDKNLTEKHTTLIIGASSAGLVSALSMVHTPNSNLAHSSRILIIDKRRSYSREQWFDLIGEPFYHTLDVLFNDLAFNSQTSHFVNETNDNLTTILLPATALERFLAKTVHMIGISVRYHQHFIGYCEQYPNIAIIAHMHKNINHQLWNCLKLNENEENNLELYVKELDDDERIDSYSMEKFTVLIGADGTHSSVRDLYQLGWYQQTTIDITKFMSQPSNKQTVISVDNLHQISLLVNFRAIHFNKDFDEHNPYESHNCPSLKLGSDGRVLDPWTASFVISGVDSVFKRFYFNDCQMQILLTHEMGQNIEKNEHLHIIWNIILRTAIHYLSNPPLNIQQLKDEYLMEISFEIETENDFVDDQQLFLILRHAIWLPMRSIKLLNLQSLKSENIETKDAFALIYLTGDSCMKSHYRLGVGINRILHSFQSHVQFYWHLQMRMRMEMKLIDFIIDFTAEMEEQLTSLVQFQTSTIFMEAYCNFIVFFEENVDAELEKSSYNMNDMQMLVKRNPIFNDYEIMDNITESNILVEQCLHKYHDIIVKGH